MRNKAYASLLVVVILVSLGAGYFFGTTSQRTNLVSITTVGDETFVTWHTTLNNCASCTASGGGAPFTFPLSINYSGGLWSLHYWVQNYTGTQNSISGSLYGSENSSIWITFYVAGYTEYTFCVSATPLPLSQQQYDLPLTLSGLGRSVSTTNSTSTVEACSTMAV
jgi:hypothetical protein